MESRCIVNKIWRVVEMFIACFGVHVALGTTTTVDTCPAPHIVDTPTCHVWTHPAIDRLVQYSSYIQASQAKHSRRTSQCLIRDDVSAIRAGVSKADAYL